MRFSRLRHRRAAAGSQYALIVGLVGVVALAATALLGANVQKLLQRTANAMGNVSVTDAGAGNGGGGGGGGGPTATAAYAWGGGYGSLPVAIPGGQLFTKIAVPGASGGQSGACGINGSGGLYCWADLGTPTAKSGGISFKDISAGGALGGGGNVAFCGISQAGAMYCWARDDAAPTAYPATSGSPVFTKVALSAWAACALSASSGQYCWGASWYGIFGDGNATGDSVNPTPVNPGHSYTSLYAGYDLMCGLDGAAKAWCSGMAWGDVNAGSTPTATMSTQSFASLAVGQYHVCGRTTAGAVYCTGAGGNNYGQLGGASATTAISGYSFSAIGAGDTYSCGVSGGAGYCWGRNSAGQLGDGTTTQRSAPQPVSPPSGGSTLSFSSIVGSGAGGSVTYGLLQ